MDLLEEVRADVEEAKTIEAGVATFVRGLVTKLRLALGEHYAGDAKAIMDEAGNNADTIGEAVKANVE
jgi:hypothetical protein